MWLVVLLGFFLSYLDGCLLGHPPRLRGEEDGGPAHAFPHLGGSQGGLLTVYQNTRISTFSNTVRYPNTGSGAEHPNSEFPITEFPNTKYPNT